MYEPTFEPRTEIWGPKWDSQPLGRDMSEARSCHVLWHSFSNCLCLRETTITLVSIVNLRAENRTQYQLITRLPRLGGLSYTWNLRFSRQRVWRLLVVLWVVAPCNVVEVCQLPYSLVTYVLETSSSRQEFLCHSTVEWIFAAVKWSQGERNCKLRRNTSPSISEGNWNRDDTIASVKRFQFLFFSRRIRLVAGERMKNDFSPRSSLLLVECCVQIGELAVGAANWW